jgi:hypothetical protein
LLQAALLVDAEERLRSVDYRTAIPLAAMACEVAVDRYADRQTKLGSNQVKAILKLPGLTFAQRRLEQLPMAVCSRSLLQDDPQAFRAVDAVYAERNKIMHRGEVSEAFAVTPRPDQAVRVHQWISAVERAVAWLEQLPPTA